MKSATLSLGCFLLVVFLLANALALAGCAKHVAVLTPAQNFSLTTDQALDVIAHANQLVEQTVSGLPQGVLAVNTQRDIISYTAEAAVVIANAHTALGSNQTTAVRTAAVVTALQAITQLPASVQALVSNPVLNATVVNIVTLIQNSVGLAKALISNVQTTPTATATPAPIVTRALVQEILRTPPPYQEIK